MAEIEDVQGYLRLRVWFPQQEPYAVLTSYVLLAVGSDLFEAVPYLYFQGPPGSGKTEAGGLLAVLAGGRSSASISKAALFRWLDERVGRLLFIDEASGLSNRDYADILNTGYRRGGVVLRCEGSSHTPTRFKIYGPKIFAANRALRHGALESRCIPVEFAEAPMDFVPLARDRAQEKVLRHGAREWVNAHAAAICKAHEQWRGDTSFFSSQRMRQIYSPLFAIGEVAGILDSLRGYAEAHQHRRALLHSMSETDRLDRIIETLPAFCREQGLPQGKIPFSAIREFVRGQLDGDCPTDKAIVGVLQRKGYRGNHDRAGSNYSVPFVTRIFGGM